MDLKKLKNLAPWEWPEDTGGRLLAVLKDERTSEADLLLAAEFAGDYTVVDDELVVALLSLVRDGRRAERVRSEAAIALGPALESADMEDFDETDPTPESPISQRTFQSAQRSLAELYRDSSVPKQVRRRILEASVRAPQDWHQDAIRAAFASGDDEWRLTAVFSMGYAPGFDRQIVESLASRDPEVHYQAVVAAGVWSVLEAAEHVAALATAPGTPKPLRLAAIEAVASIQPDEAASILADLCHAADQDVADAAQEALAMAEGALGHGDAPLH